MVEYQLQLQQNNIKMSSSKSSRKIQKKESGPDRSVSNYQFPSTPNELAIKKEKANCKIVICTRVLNVHTWKKVKEHFKPYF